MIDYSREYKNFQDIYEALGQIPTMGNNTKIMAKIFDLYEETVRSVCGLLDRANEQLKDIENNKNKEE